MTTIYRKLLIVLCIAGLLIQCAQKELEDPKMDHIPVVAKREVKKPLIQSSQQSLEAAVLDLLALGNLDSVFPSVNDETGYVLLMGTVPDEKTKAMLMNVVKNLRGARNVKSDLTIEASPTLAVTASEPRSYWSRIFDSWILLLAIFGVGGLIVWAWRRRGSSSQPRTLKKFDLAARRFVSN